MTPIVRVIAHTTFLGVPPDLLPIAKTKQQQEARYADAIKDCDAFNEKEQAKGSNLRQMAPEQFGYLSDRVIEAEARRLIDASGQDRGTDAERLIECAGRNCYDSYGIGRPSNEYHQHILDVNHGSVSEHASLTFYLANISRGLTHELVRHRVGVAISQRSTRYVDENESDWALHPLTEAYFASGKDVPHRAPNGEPTEITLKQMTDHAVSAARRGYRDTVEDLQRWLIERGVDKFTARKQARGAARGLLGNALCTEMVWTCNVRALRTVIAQRVKEAADAEIRVLFGMIYEAAKPYWPTYLGTYAQRPCADGLGFELYEPDSPVEKLKKADAEVQRLRERLAEVTNGSGLRP